MSKKLTMEEISERFWMNVNKTDTCWLWTGKIQEGGHGQTSFRGKSIGAHRLSWILSHGEIEPDEHGHTFRKIVCHKCDNKNCVNPNHLYLGDHLTNATDRVRSGKYRGSNYVSRYKNEFGPLSATVFFDDDNMEYMELLEWLQTLPHGSFSEETKSYWKEKMSANLFRKVPSNLPQHNLATPLSKEPLEDVIKRLKEEQGK